MKNYLQVAHDLDIFVTFALWNGALMRNSTTKKMLTDDSKVQSWIQNALIPMVNGLKYEHALAGWEIFNEPEGSVYADRKDSEPCFDTQKLKGTGAGWAGAYLEMKQIQKIVNWSASAIHNIDPDALVTVGSWS